MNIEERVNKIVESEFRIPLIIVLATGVISGVVSWIVSSKIHYIWPENMPVGQYWGVIMAGSTLISGIIVAVVTWVFLFGAIHIIARAFGGFGEVQRVLKVGGYIFLILLVGNIVSAIAVPFIPEMKMDLSYINEETPDISEILDQTKEYQTSTGYILYESIITIFKAVAMIFTI
ncbi:MAG TPA: YIP1 family protein, partial [Euryarchaeota archaeon]|nr:YIP1 family protein [Euryarchaeota archaeon]